MCSFVVSLAQETSGCVGGKSHRPDLDLHSSGESVAFGLAGGTVL